MSEELTFEQLRAELEEIVRRLEGGDVPVDEAIELFGRGEELYRLCVQRLEQAELRVEEITARPDESA